MNHNKVRSLPTEPLLYIIDADFQAVLRPLNLFQAIFVTSKFNISSNIIEPKSKTYHIKSAFAAIISIIIHWCRFSIYYVVNVQEHKFSTIELLLWFDCFYYSIATAISYIISAVQSDNTVLLIIKLQQALRTTNINTKTMYHIMIWNWIYLISILSIYVFCIVNVSGIFHNQINVVVALLIFPMFLFDLNLICASRYVTIICYVLEMWNKKMLMYEKNHYQDTQENQLNGNAMFNAYLDIIKSFRLTEKIHQVAVSIF